MIALLLLACCARAPVADVPMEPVATATDEATTADEPIAAVMPPSPTSAPLAWVARPELAEAGVTVQDAFPPPYGARRVEADAWGDWLHHRTLRHADDPVRTFADTIIRTSGARVVDLPLVPGDLQQCADAIIRLRAEWQKETGQSISFHATSGDPLPWDRWQAGERPYAPGDQVLWRPGTRGGWEEYLAKVFTWAGSWSLEEYETELATTPAPGMILVQGGFPGHAVLLLDVATDGERTWLLVGQSFMPAQDFHVDLGPHAGWWEWQPHIRTNTWLFFDTDLRDWR